jgi:hypothetical protein
VQPDNSNSASIKRGDKVDRRLILVVALLIASSIAFAAAPTVNFNIVPSYANSGQTVTFDPTVTCNPDCNFFMWRFDTDNNVNYYNLKSSDLNVIDDFETGTIGANWTVVGSPKINSAVVKNGVYSVALRVNDSMTIPVTSTADMNYLVWMQSLNATDYSYFMLLDASGNIIAPMYLGTGVFKYGRGGSPGNYDTLPAVSPDANKWYGLGINYQTGSNSVGYFIYDQNGTLLDSVIGIGPWNVGPAKKLRITRTANDGNVYYDDVRTGRINSTSLSPINIDKNEIHIFNSTGLKTITLLAGNKDGNTVVSKNISISGINCYFYDENSNNQISPSSVSINGVHATLTGNNLFIETTNMPTDYNVLVADSNYGTRYFYFHDLSNANPVDINLFMLDNTRGINVPFKFFHTNKTNVLANARVKVVRKNTDANVVSIVLTDSSGRANIFLNSDANYTFNIDANNNGDSDFNYKQVILMVNIPKDEITAANVTPFHVFVDRLSATDLNNLTVATSFPAFSNTVEYYGISVNKPTGTDYTNSRYYLYRTTGDPRTDSIQPYLVADAQGGFSSSIHLVDLYNRFPQSNLIIKSTTTTSSGSTLVESRITDSTGRTLMSFILNKDYILEFDTNGPDQNYIGTATVNAQSSTYVFALNISTNDYNIAPSQYVDLNYVQSDLHSPLFDVNFCWTSTSPLGYYIWKVYDDQGTNLTAVPNGKVVLNPANSGCDGNTFNYTRPVGYGTIIVSTVEFVSPNFDINYKKLYSIYSGNETPLKTSMVNLGSNFGILGTTILAILLALSVHGATAYFATSSTNGLFLLFGAVAGGFAFMGWIDFTSFVFAAFFSLFAWIYANRGV